MFFKNIHQVQNKTISRDENITACHEEFGCPEVKRERLLVWRSGPPLSSSAPPPASFLPPRPLADAALSPPAGPRPGAASSWRRTSCRDNRSNPSKSTSSTLLGDTSFRETWQRWKINQEHNFSVQLSRLSLVGRCIPPSTCSFSFDCLKWRHACCPDPAASAQSSAGSCPLCVAGWGPYCPPCKWTSGTTKWRPESISVFRLKHMNYSD